MSESEHERHSWDWLYDKQEHDVLVYIGEVAYPATLTRGTGDDAGDVTITLRSGDFPMQVWVSDKEGNGSFVNVRWMEGDI